MLFCLFPADCRHLHTYPYCILMNRIKSFCKGVDQINSVALASVKHSCESILESFVSRFENHFDVRRNVNEYTSNEEFTITCNGPNLANCNGMVREAMEDYWRSKGSSWHFLRASVLEQLTQEKESTVLKRMLRKKNTYGLVATIVGINYMCRWLSFL